MKITPRFPNLLTWLDSHNLFMIAQCYTLKLLSPTPQTLYITSCDIDITYPDIDGVNRTFVHARDNEGLPLIKRGEFSVTKGLETSELELTLLCGDKARLPGIDIPVPLFALNGGFDGAEVLIEWAYMGQSGWGETNVVGAVPMFQGTVADASPSTTQVVLKCTSDVERLNTLQLPKHIFEVSCQNVLGDDNCGVNVPALTATSAVYGSPTKFKFNSTLTRPNGYYNMGIITFTTGVLTGTKVACRDYKQTSGAIQVATPLPAVPGIGDQFTITPGCPKSIDACKNKFNNLCKYRGFPYIPEPEQALR